MVEDLGWRRADLWLDVDAHGVSSAMAIPSRVCNGLLPTVPILAVSMAASMVVAAPPTGTSTDAPSPPAPTPAPSNQPRPAAAAKATMTLISDVARVAPGQEFTLALHFKMQPGWHIYWNGINDTGFPPNWELELPPGFEVGEAMWPGPKRYISPGEILDHVYEESVAILIPVRAPATLPGGEIAIRVASKWLVCKDICLAEEGSASLTLSSASGADGSGGGGSGVIRAMRERLPLERLPEGASASIESGGRGGTLEVRVPGARKVEFYPESEGIEASELIRGGSAGGELLKLRVGAGVEAMTGVVGVWWSAGREPRGTPTGKGGEHPVFYRVSLDVR